MAWLQTSAQRPLTPPPKHFPNDWERPSGQVPPSDRRRDDAAHVSPQSKPCPTAHGKRGPRSPLFQRRSKAQEYSDVPHVSLEGGPREEEEAGEPECAEKRGRAEDCGRSGGLQWHFCK